MWLVYVDGPGFVVVDFFEGAVIVVGEDDEVGVELPGEGEDLGVVKIAEGFAGGEEGLAAVVDDHAGLERESSHAIPPGLVKRAEK